MDAVIYQPKFLAVTNTAKKDIEYVSNGNITEMQTLPIISIKNYFTITGNLDADDGVYIVTESNDNSFFCTFVRIADGKTILQIKRKLNKQEVNKLKRLWQTKG